jgi:hypothetical protein
MYQFNREETQVNDFRLRIIGLLLQGYWTGRDLPKEVENQKNRIHFIWPIIVVRFTILAKTNINLLTVRSLNFIHHQRKRYT